MQSRPTPPYTLPWEGIAQAAHRGNLLIRLIPVQTTALMQSPPTPPCTLPGEGIAQAAHRGNLLILKIASR